MPQIHGVTRGPQPPRWEIAKDDGTAQEREASALQRRNILPIFFKGRIKSSEVTKGNEKTLSGPFCVVSSSSFPPPRPTEVSGSDQASTSDWSTSTSSSDESVSLFWAVDLLMSTVGDELHLIDFLFDSESDEDDQDRKSGKDYNIMVETWNSDQSRKPGKLPSLTKEVISSDDDFKVGHSTWCVDPAWFWETVENLINTGSQETVLDDIVDMTISSCGTPCDDQSQLKTKGWSKRNDSILEISDSERSASNGWNETATQTTTRKYIPTESQIKERDDRAVPVTLIEKSTGKHSATYSTAGTSKALLDQLNANAKTRNGSSRPGEMKTVEAQSKLKERIDPTANEEEVEFEPTRFPTDHENEARVSGRSTRDSKALNGFRKIIRNLGRCLANGLQRARAKQPKLVSQVNCVDARPLLKGAHVDNVVPRAGSVIDTGCMSQTGDSAASRERKSEERSKQRVLCMGVSEISSGISTLIEDWSLENSRSSEEELHLVLLDRFSTTESLYFPPKTPPPVMAIKSEELDDELQELWPETKNLQELWRSETNTSLERDVGNFRVENESQLPGEENTTNKVSPKDTNNEHGTTFKVNDVLPEAWWAEGIITAGSTSNINHVSVEDLWDNFRNETNAEDIPGSSFADEDFLENVWFDFGEGRE